MADVLIDTSVWIDALRGGNPRLREAVDELLDREKATLCGLVELELIQGFRDHQRAIFAPLFEALPYAEVDRRDWITAGSMLADLRSHGTTIPATDALIASLCIRYDFLLFTLDKHFDRIPQLKRFRIA